MKLIDTLKANADANQITVLTPAEAREIYDHIEHLYTRIETKELKFIALCEQTYEMVKVNRDLKKMLDMKTNDGGINAAPTQEPR